MNVAWISIGQIEIFVYINASNPMQIDTIT
jgi:hypothetical protein